MPGSHERLVKVFTLQHAHAGLLKDKINSIVREGDGRGG